MRLRAAAVNTIRKFEEEGWPITKTAIAEEAGVSLYIVKQPEVAREVEAAIRRQVMSYSAANSNSARPSLRGLKTQLANALEQNRKLSERNARLKNAMDLQDGLKLEDRLFTSPRDDNVTDVKVMELQREVTELRNLVKELRGEIAGRVEEVQALRSRLKHVRLVSVGNPPAESPE